MLAFPVVSIRTGFLTRDLRFFAALRMTGGWDGAQGRAAHEILRCAQNDMRGGSADELKGPTGLWSDFVIFMSIVLS